MKLDIHLERGNPTAARVLLDDQDITKYVLAEGFGVVLDDRNPVVTLRLRPTVLNVTELLPDGTQLVVACDQHHATDDDSTT